MITNEVTILQKTRELKTARDQLMPPQQNLCNELADPCGLFHFCTGMDSPACG